MSGQNIIDEAIDQIRDRGWWRSELAVNNRVCIVTALCAVSGGRLNSRDRAYAALAEELGVGRREVVRDIARFNDDPTTSYEDMMLVLKKASARLDEAQGA